jgi:hypothetical protein
MQSAEQTFLSATQARLSNEAIAELLDYNVIKFGQHNSNDGYVLSYAGLKLDLRQ